MRMYASVSVCMCVLCVCVRVCVCECECVCVCVCDFISSVKGKNMETHFQCTDSKGIHVSRSANWTLS